MKSTGNGQLFLSVQEWSIMGGTVARITTFTENTTFICCLVLEKKSYIFQKDSLTIAKFMA